MATWMTRIRITTRHEWVVPMRNGSNDHAQLLQAIHAARAARAARDRAVSPDRLSDDAVMVSIGDDDEIVLWFETDEVNDR